MIYVAYVESPGTPLLATSAFMLVVVACGGVAIWLTCRWFRTLKQPQSITGEALAQLADALEQPGDLKPEERERVRAAIERQKAEMAKGVDKEKEAKGGVEAGRQAQ